MRSQTSVSGVSCLMKIIICVQSNFRFRSSDGARCGSVVTQREGRDAAKRLLPFRVVARAGRHCPRQGWERVFYSGFDGECSPADADLDRFSGCQESGLKLDPAQADSDGDGLEDGDEVLGTLGGPALLAIGVDARRKNILIEYGWFEGANEAGGPNNCRAGRARQGDGCFRCLAGAPSRRVARDRRHPRCRARRGPEWRGCAAGRRRHHPGLGQQRRNVDAVRHALRSFGSGSACCARCAPCSPRRCRATVL